MCQGAGACFYIAGICAMERWHRYRKSLKEEEENSDTRKEDGNWSTLTQEKKIDHAGQAIEVFTRAHEVYKRFQMQRQSLLVASKIAIAYVEGGQNEMALRFLERIAKSFVSEGCVIDNVESKGRALWSLLSISIPLSKGQRDAALQALHEWMTQDAANTDAAKRIQIESSGSSGCLLVKTTFAKEKMELNEHGVLFQLSITTPSGLPLSGLKFESLSIQFANVSTPYIITHREGDNGEKTSVTSLQDIYLVESLDEKTIGEGGLRWWSEEGDLRVFQGRVIPSQLGTLKIEKVSLRGKGACTFSLDFQLEQHHDDEEAFEQVNPCFVQPRWITALHPMRYILLPYRPNRDGVLIHRRAHRVHLEIHKLDSAYPDEGFKITLSIRNEEASDVECYVEASVQSDLTEVGVDELYLQDAEDASFRQSKISETSIGLLQPNATLEKHLILHCRQSLRSRVVDILLRTQLSDDDGSPGGHSSEISETISIPVKALFAPSFYGSWRQIKESTLMASTLLASRKPSITVSDADEEYEGSEGSSEITISTSLDGDVTSVGIIASVNIALTVLAKEQIRIRSVHLLLDQSSRHLRLANEVETDSATREMGDLWTGGDRWGGVFDIEVLSEKATGFTIEGEDGTLRPTGQLQVKWQRNDMEEKSDGTLHTAIMDIPLLLPPMLLSRIVLSIPISTTLDQPLIMLLSIVNPARLPAEIFIAIDDGQSDFGVLSHKTFTVPLIAKSSRSIPVHVLAKSSKSAPSSTIRYLPKLRAWQRDRRGKREEAEMVNQGGAPMAPIVPIMNQHKGGGLPLEVQLRYARAGQAPGSTPANGSVSHAVAQLQAESQRSGGLYTIFTHSQAEINIKGDGKASPLL